jgi:hypothetical protein
MSSTDATQKEKPPFDLSRYMRTISVRGGGKVQYLTAWGRVQWLRYEQPTAQVVTECLMSDDKMARFRCEITLPNGAKATAHGQETKADFPDYFEKAECCPVDTEILTHAGWKHPDDLIVGELVLAYDSDHDCAEWVPLQRIVRYENASLVRVSNGWGFDAQCTPDHSWVVQTAATSGGKRYEYRRLKPLREIRSGNIITACPAPAGESLIAARDAAILGWLMTDGSVRRNGKTIRSAIFQSKPERIAELDALLAEVPHRRTIRNRAGALHTFPSDRTYRTLPQVRWSFSADTTRNFLALFDLSDLCEIERVIPTLAVEARRAMLDAMMAADGDARGTFGKKRRPWVMRVFALLCTLEGVALPATKYSHGFPSQRMKRTRRTDVTHLVREDASSGSVWCPTTKYGTWYARFANGMTTITGNTVALSRALAILGYGTDGAHDLDAREPSVENKDRAQMGERLSSPAEKWFRIALPARGMTLPKRFELWGDVIGVIAKAGVDVAPAVDDAGIDYTVIKQLVEALPLKELVTAQGGAQ